jgi:hypothetical protein
VWTFRILKALELLARTFPFLLLRVIVYLGTAMAMILLTWAGAWVGEMMAPEIDEAARMTSTLWGAVGGVILAATGAFLFRAWRLHRIKAPHVAVMITLLDGGNVPLGPAQIALGQTAVRDRFGAATPLYVVDRLIKGVISAISAFEGGLERLMQVPVLGGILALIRSLLKYAVGLVHEVIIGHAIRHRDGNPWEVVQDGLVLYGQNARKVMTGAVVLTLAVWSLMVLLLLAMLGPAAFIMGYFPLAWPPGVFVIAALLAWAIKVAIIEPFAVATLLQTFIAVIEGQSMNAAWAGRLTRMSAKFRVLGELAADRPSAAFEDS